MAGRSNHPKRWGISEGPRARAAAVPVADSTGAARDGGDAPDDPSPLMEALEDCPLSIPTRVSLWQCACPIEVLVQGDEFAATCDDCGARFTRVEPGPGR